MGLESLKGIEIDTDEELSLLKEKVKKNKDGKEDGKKTKEQVKEKTTPPVNDPVKLDKDPKKTVEAEKPVKVTSGFNALETAIDLKGNARIRNYANLGLQFKLGNNSLQLGYSGMFDIAEGMSLHKI